MTAPVLIGYFKTPFATSGDGAPIPQTSQINGSISYPIGYGPDYELNLLSDPTAQPVGRLTMNQLFFEITAQLQQYSQQGTPNFITSAQNGGSPFAYPLYANVLYTDGNIYQNQVASNLVAPGVDNSWLVTSGDATGVPTGTMLDFGGFAAPAGYLSTDGSAVLRASYGPLMAVITQTQTGTTTNTMAAVTGLTSTAQMYVGMEVESANFTSGTTIASITSSTSITVTPVASGSGAVSIQFFNWGNGDGSTTFNLPLKTGNVSAGQGGNLLSNAGPLPDAVGQSIGVKSYALVSNNLPAHVHPQDPGTLYGSGGSGQFNSGGAGGAGSKNTGSNSTSNTPISLLQPTVITYNIIKT